jgi:hypothetical protein
MNLFTFLSIFLSYQKTALGHSPPTGEETLGWGKNKERVKIIKTKNQPVG